VVAGCEAWAVAAAEGRGDAVGGGLADAPVADGAAEAVTAGAGWDAAAEADAGALWDAAPEGGAGADVAAGADPVARDVATEPDGGTAGLRAATEGTTEAAGTPAPDGADDAPPEPQPATSTAAQRAIRVVLTPGSLACRS
jgi:hypothetical protein